MVGRPEQVFEIPEAQIEFGHQLSFQFGAPNGAAPTVMGSAYRVDAIRPIARKNRPGHGNRDEIII